MSSKPVKVNDRRMFTRDGELREEFSHLAESAGAGDGEAAESSHPNHDDRTVEPSSRTAAPPPSLAPRVVGYPEPATGGPSFFDLVGLLTEPASVYLQEARSGDAGSLAASNRSEQSLELARLHIDLLATLREKTAGNLGPREEAMLDDVLYRLRSAYVQIKEMR